MNASVTPPSANSPTGSGRSWPQGQRVGHGGVRPDGWEGRRQRHVGPSHGQELQLPGGGAENGGRLRST